MRNKLSMGAVAALLALAGCGTGANFRNEPRPATPLVVSAAITPGGITVSPNNFGAGLVQLLVTNLTGSSQQVILQQSGAGQPTGETSPINPQDIAQLKTNVPEGTYSLSVSDPTIAPATLNIGPPRPPSNNNLLGP